MIWGERNTISFFLLVAFHLSFVVVAYEYESSRIGRTPSRQRTFNIDMPVYGRKKRSADPYPGPGGSGGDGSYYSGTPGSYGSGGDGSYSGTPGSYDGSGGGGSYSGTPGSYGSGGDGSYYSGSPGSYDSGSGYCSCPGPTQPPPCENNSPPPPACTCTDQHHPQGCTAGPCTSRTQTLVCVCTGDSSRDSPACIGAVPCKPATPGAMNVAGLASLNGIQGDGPDLLGLGVGETNVLSSPDKAQLFADLVPTNTLGATNLLGGTDLLGGGLLSGGLLSGGLLGGGLLGTTSRSNTGLLGSLLGGNINVVEERQQNIADNLRILEALQQQQSPASTVLEVVPQTQEFLLVNPQSQLQTLQFPQQAGQLLFLTN